MIPLRAMLVVGALAVAGCGLIGEADPAPSPPMQVPLELESLDWADSTPEEPARSRYEILLDGESLLAEGRIPEAVEAFQGYLAFDGPAAESPRAIWGLALARFIPGTEAHDPERARRHLDSLAEDHPESVQGLQARWLLDVLAELDRSRTAAAEQTRLVEQLTEMVEQLRRIDLNRRPAGHPDSLPDLP